ncbi:MAG: DUF2115 domain-containing protein [Methanobacteriaceae archaeon]
MHSKVKGLTLRGQTTKNELLVVLQDDARQVGLDEIMRSSLHLQRDAKYVQASYREEYIKAYTNGFLIRIKEVKEEKQNYSGPVDVEELDTAIELLEEQEKMVESREDAEPAFFQIYKIISLYTTFIKEEPIHQVGTPFPGGFQVKKDKDRFTCPVKKNNEDNPLAVCPFCIAEQEEDV